MTEYSRRRFLVAISGTVAISGCLGEDRQREGVSREEFERLKRRVDELEDIAQENGSEPNRYLFGKDQIVTEEKNGTEVVEISGRGGLDAVTVKGPNGSATTEEPTDKPVRIGGEGSDLEYVPGFSYEVLGRLGEREERILNYTTPRAGPDRRDRESEEDTDGSDGSQEESQRRDVGDKSPGVAVSFVEDAARRELEVYVRPPGDTDGVDADVLKIRGGDNETVRMESPSPGDVLEVGGSTSGLRYRTNETYSVVSEVDGTNVTVREYTTEAVR